MKVIFATVGVLGLFLSAHFSARADTVAFFYALDKDFQTLKAEAQPVGPPFKVGSRSLQQLSLGAHRVYAVKMGSGAVETAASVQALLARVKCDAAFFRRPRRRDFGSNPNRLVVSRGKSCLLSKRFVVEKRFSTFRQRQPD